MPQKGKNIYQRKDGRWEGRYIKGRTEAGKAVYGYVYAHTYEEVTKKRDEAADGVDPEKLKKNVPKKDSAEAVAIEWLYSLKPQIKQSTFCKYHTSIYCYIIPELGQKDINDISVMDLQNFCNNLFSTTNTRSKPLSSKTVSDTMSVMRRILHYAYIHGYQPACNGREIVIRKTAPDIVVLSASDQRILCKYLFEHKSHRNLGILICLFTGIRVGELCALKWEDVSLEKKNVYVHKTMQRSSNYATDGPRSYIEISTPKSKCSFRKIPLPDALIDYIQENYPDQHGYVLTSSEDKYLEPRTMQKHFRLIQQKCGLDPVKFHSLRHTFATRCVELDFDIKSLSEILGHATVNITLNRYVHPSMELKQQNMQKMSALMKDLSKIP